MPGPLHGFRIIDLTTMISGPLATMTLADQGAEVIKIEHPDGGDLTVTRRLPSQHASETVGWTLKPTDETPTER